LAGLLRSADITAEIFRYAYPNEVHALSLGFVARGDGNYIGVADGLAAVPDVLVRFVNFDTIQVLSTETVDDEMTDRVIRLDGRTLRRQLRSTAGRAVRRLRG
jgi:hypothetical protein